MKDVKPTPVDIRQLTSLLGIESSKLGYYNDVKQKIQELETANLCLHIKKTELQAVFDAVGDAVIIYDHFGSVLYRNQACRRLFPKATIIGKSYKEFCNKDSDFDCPIRDAINNGQSSQFSFSGEGGGPGGKGYYDATVTPIPAQPDAPSQGNRALVFIRDVTERRLHELQLLQAEKMSGIGLLAAGVAHEINNPMTSVAGYAEALLRRFREDETLVGDQRLIDFPKYLDVIIREVYRCKAIINSLQSFSRKSDGANNPVDLNEIINEVLDLVRHTWREKNITFIQNLSPIAPIIQGDSSAIRQIFLNLVLNALQSIEHQGSISLTSGIVSKEVIVTIADTGCGIPPENLEEIWTPFFTTKGVGDGQGLGLAVTYDIVKKHQGTISVDSVLGKGTEFTLRFPRN
ncbi:ATP-binding protein [Desulfuromonas thiophila]|uniref:two-component system sensor histidine kinase NtrB n=1 Tax=Desulfuromonas thiophila TaxID=57664 RepID=UPI0029F4E3B5|nr:ATP-binding protein [Desulfuromonas thiophila]